MAWRWERRNDVCESIFRLRESGYRLQIVPLGQPPDQVASGPEFESLIADLSSRFLDLPPSEVDNEIQRALSRACGVLGVDFASLWEWSTLDPERIAPTHVVYASGDRQPPERMRDDQFPWFRQEIRAGRRIVLSSLDQLPEDAARDREAFLHLEVKSNLTLPLAVGGEPPIGVLSFSTLAREREWPEALLQRLQLVAELFTNAITRRRHDLNLKEIGERLSLAADAAEAGLWMLDSQRGDLWLTDRARTILDFPRGEGATLARLMARVHPEDQALFDGAIRRSLQTGETFSIEFRIALANERRARWVAMRGRPRSQMPGDPEQLTGAIIDITGRKRVEAALRKSEARLAASAELAGLAYYELNFVEGTAFVDEPFRDLLGIPRNLTGLGPLDFWREHLHPDDRESVLNLRAEMHAGRFERVVVEYRFLHPTRGEIWLHHVARATRRDGKGRAVGAFGVVRDITESRRREEDLRRSNAEIAALKDRLQAETEYLKAEMGAIRPSPFVTGESPAIQQVLRLVERVAPTNSAVLIHGETGTGKELVAQALHRQSSRGQKLMVSINCAALPTGLVESELFGRERGAFTGALTRQIGRFELADRSTLFLDEIGELSLEVQAKLLRVLESGEFERLGSSRTTKADVRIIAATNRDLQDEVRKGRFREDLYYRLNVFPIRVPPLRERPEDIPVLAWAFLEEVSSRMGKKITQITRKTMEILQRHHWPGNVRELRNVIEHAAILAVGDTLRIDELAGVANLNAPPPRLIDSERELIQRALQSAGGRIKGPKGAASALGLNPSTLYSRMKKLGIQVRRSRPT